MFLGERVEAPSKKFTFFLRIKIKYFSFKLYGWNDSLRGCPALAVLGGVAGAGAGAAGASRGRAGARDAGSARGALPPRELPPLPPDARDPAVPPLLFLSTSSSC